MKIFSFLPLLMQHAGGFHLDDVRDIKMDTALRTLFELKQVPQAGSLSNWLRRMGKNPQVYEGFEHGEQSRFGRHTA